MEPKKFSPFAKNRRIYFAAKAVFFASSVWYYAIENKRKKVMK